MKFFAICLICFFGIAVTAYAGDKDTNIQKALAEIKAEPQVKDAVYSASAAIQWHVGVLSDGTAKHGYASYICELLRENGVVSRDTWVRVVDIVKVKNGSNFREASLGCVNCFNYKRQLS